MSVSGPSPLGTLMVQRVEAALGTTLAQQSNIASGARPDAVTRPGQPDKVDPAKNPPPERRQPQRQEGVSGRGERQAGLAALSRDNPEIAKLLAARNAPMTAYTTSAPTSLGQAAKALLLLFQQFPEMRPVVTGRTPLLSQAPGTASLAQPGQQTVSPSPLPGSGTGSPPATGGSAGTSAGESAGSAAGGGGASGAQSGGQPSGQEATGNLQSGTQTTTSSGQGAAPATASGPGTMGAPASGPQTASSTPPPQPGSAHAATQTGGTTFAAGNAPVARLAAALNQALSGSGIFYESHLRDFAFGQKSLGQLHMEPQAQLGFAQREGSGTGTHSAANAPGESRSASAHSQTAQSQSTQTQSPQTHGSSSQTSQALAHTQPAQPQNTQGQSVQPQTTTTHTAHTAFGTLVTVDPAAQLLVRQQLEVLATQTMVWQGEAWPGTEMEWEVGRQQHSEPTENECDSWSTRLKLALPGLGDVEARISLAGSQLVMHVVSPQGAELLSSHADLLRSRLHAQGLNVQGLAITAEAHAEATS